MSGQQKKVFKNSGIFIQWNTISSENTQTTTTISDMQESNKSNTEQKNLNTTDSILCGSICKVQKTGETVFRNAGVRKARKLLLSSQDSGHLEKVPRRRKEGVITRRTRMLLGY